MPNTEKPAVGTAGEVNSSAGRAHVQGNYSTTPAKPQAPSGSLRPYVKDGLICVGGRHLCSVHDGVLRRTFDGTRELLKGGLAFRCDVLDLAAEHGATMICATERGSGRVYTVSLATFRATAWFYRSAQFGDQWVLPLSFWQHESEPGAPEQMSLFEGAKHD